MTWSIDMTTSLRGGSTSSIDMKSIHDIDPPLDDIVIDIRWIVTSSDDLESMSYDVVIDIFMSSTMSSATENGLRRRRLGHAAGS